MVEQNTISRLSGLEELSLPPEFYIHEELSLPSECAKGGSLLVLDEVSELSCLTKSKSSKLTNIYHNLSEFHLFFGR